MSNESGEVISMYRDDVALLKLLYPDNILDIRNITEKQRRALLRLQKADIAGRIAVQGQHSAHKYMLNRSGMYTARLIQSIA